MKSIMRHVVLTTLCFFLSFLASVAAAQQTRHQEGLRENPPNSFALKGATVVASPGKVIEDATVIIRNGVFTYVGTSPENLADDLQVIDVSGKTIYPGMIDSFTEQQFTALASEQGTPYWSSNITPHLNAVERLEKKDEDEEAYRKQGITTRLVAPQDGIIKGTSALILTSDAPLSDCVLKPYVAQHMHLTARFRFGGGGQRIYPTSPMGAVALARQTMYDATWYQKALQTVSTGNADEPLEDNLSLKSLEPVITGEMPVVINTSNELFVMRADRFAREFGLKLIVNGNGNEYRRLEEVAAIGRPILVPVDFPETPDVATPAGARDVSLETLMHWDHAPQNAARLVEAGVTIAFTSQGLDDKADFLKNIRKAIERGLDKDKALAAVTTAPAEIFGVDNRVGKISKGMLANLLITDGDLFAEKTKIKETWVAGKRFQHSKDPLREAKGVWDVKTSDDKFFSFTVSGADSLSAELGDGKKDEGEDKGKEAKESTQDDAKESGDEKKSDTKFKSVKLVGARLTGAFPSETIGKEGVSSLSMVIGSGDGEPALGIIRWPDGIETLFKATLRDESESDKGSEESNEAEDDSDKKEGKKKSDEKDDKLASFPVNYPLGAYGRTSLPDEANVLITNVTIWTCEEQGIVKGHLHIKDGVIAGVYTDKEQVDAGEATTIDGTGMHVTPGIIDCHSHMASDSGINEGGSAITAEVRIGDMIDPDDITIYRQLAGGVTASNILHGSANPIGGQNQVIKLRWGASEQEMKMSEAPQGIKFALGENVKRSRSPDSTRYPKTRMGVEQIINDAFEAALDYKKARDEWNLDPKGLPPRRDLELDALTEILEGKRWVHCHSYRQDEILALIRTLDKHGITIGTFQHILEGYKVAEKMAEHGAMASAFADWWAYKFEVYDAIPFAGALMHDAGIVVSFNSDDGELGRHLNHEAAKAVKYGGVLPEEALKFVTLNPAKQLRIDQYTGSLKQGKHADVVLWSGDPLSLFSRCEKTWIDGRLYFDRSVDLEERKKVSEMRNTLIQKALASGEAKSSSGRRGRRGRRDQSVLWPRYDAFCGTHENHDCSLHQQFDVFEAFLMEEEAENEE